MESAPEAESLAPVHLPRITIRFCTQLSFLFRAIMPLLPDPYSVLELNIPERFLRLRYDPNRELC